MKELPLRVKRGMIWDADSKSDTLPLTFTSSSTMAPVVEFQPVVEATVLDARSSKKRFVLTRMTTRTVLQAAPAGMAGEAEPAETPVSEKMILGALAPPKPKLIVSER